MTTSAATTSVSPAAAPAAASPDTAQAQAHPNRIAYDLQVVLQPIINVASGELIAAEALTRFAGSVIPTDQTFAIAYASGRGPELEAACLWTVLGVRYTIPDGVLLSVNVSPDALLHPSVQEVLAVDLQGIIVEVTEQPAFDQLASNLALDALRERGALIAVDDATAGYAGLRRLASVRPDIVKLDAALVARARHNIEQTAVIEALVSLSRRLNAKVLGEGVESMDDLNTLAELGVDYAQGHAIAMPSPYLEPIDAEVIEVCRSARRSLLAPNRLLSVDPERNALHQLTTALAGTVDPRQLDGVLRSALGILGVDVIGLSVLIEPGVLQELSSTEEALDARSYLLAEYPATMAALKTGALVEAHVADPYSDAAERAVLESLGLASLLIVPLFDGDRRLGILELSHRVERRWGADELTLARLLADYVARVVARLDLSALPTRR
jgi:EAL domain-containing protein (putative c-di-GMP-specific phosphodiesterase class I)